MSVGSRDRALRVPLAFYEIPSNLYALSFTDTAGAGPLACR